MIRRGCNKIQGTDKCGSDGYDYMFKFNILDA